MLFSHQSCCIITDGLFPINLSKVQVEKDHTFLDKADLDSLIRRLNILNRCADVMDSVHNRVRLCHSHKLPCMTI